MTTRALSKNREFFPSVFEDFFKPWNEWFQPNDFMARTLTVPAVNVIEHKDEYLVTLAVPGMKKDDFKVDIDGNLLTISSEREETKEDKDEKFSRKEYNYSSFCRSFTLPETIMRDKIDAKYEEGILKLILPKREEAIRASTSKMIEVK